jgi:putative phage-type endonuclease
MKYQTIIPTDNDNWLALRTKDLTSTDSPAMVGISPYLTPYELWHRKNDGIAVVIEENERMYWGTVLQDAIAEGIAKQNGWKVKRMPNYYRIPELRLGTSLDFGIMDGNAFIDDECIAGLEIKNVDSLQFKKEWLVNDKKQIEAPYHIEMQVQHQLLVMGWKFMYIGVLIGGNRLELIKRTPDPKVQEAILTNAANFWKSIDEKNPPAPDFDTDADFIAKLCGYAEPGKVVDVSSDEAIIALAGEYLSLKEVSKGNEKRCDSIKAEILVRLGDAEKALAPTFSISAGVTAPTWVEAYERKGFRNFRITPKKEK